jgi:hypothetical protein
MGGNNLSVKITADVTDLNTKFSLARAEVSGLTSELNKLNRAQASGTLSVLPGVLQQMTGDLIAAKTQTAALGTQLFTASGGMLGMAAAAERGHGSISTATREFRALFDEISSGRTRQSPGTIAILLQRVAGLSPAMLGAVGGVAALAGGLGYLAYRALEAGRAISQIDISTTFAGNLDITRTAVQRYVDELAKASNVSSSDARKIVASFAEVPGMTNAALGTLTATIAQFAQETGQGADKAAEGLAKLFSGDTSASEFAKKMSGITQLSQAQLDQAKSADRSGDSSQVLTDKLRLLDQIVTAGTPALKSYASASADIAAALAAGDTGADQSETMITLAAGEAAAVDKATEARKRYLAVQAQSAATPEQTLKTGVSAAEGENPVAMQIEQAQSKITEMNAALGIAQQRGDQVNIDRLAAGLQKAQENLSNLQFGPVLERMREQMQEVASTWDGTQTGLLAKQIQVGQATLANVRENSKEYVAVQTEIASLEVREHQAASREVIDDARQRVADIGAIENQSALSRAAQEHAIYQGALADTRLTAAGRIEVERDIAQAATQIQRVAAQEQATISRQNVQTDIAISREQIEAQKNALQLGTAASADAVSQRLAQLRQLTASEFTLNNEALENEMQSLAQEPAEYNRVYNEIRQLKAKLVLDLQALDKEAAEANKKYAKQQGDEWKSAVGEIERAEGTFVSDVLNRRKSMAQSLAQISGQIVISEISNDLKAMTTKVLLNNQEKAMEQGGLLYHLLFQKQKTAATVASTQAQTSAVTAGQTAQNTALISGASAGKAVQAAAGPSQVMADAAEAFAGAYAATAAIPYIGPELAPAAAAEAFAAVASMAGAASLDVGTNYVPRDMYARIHEGEAVVPKEFNPAAGAGEGEGGGGYHEQHNYNGHVSLRAMDTRGIRSLLKGQGNRREIMQAAKKFISRGGGRG